MGERFSGAGWESRSERDPDVEARKHIHEIDKLLARLVESSGDLPGDIKQGLRAQLQAHLVAIGVDDIGQLMDVRMRLYGKIVDVPTPSDYPDKNEFAQSLRKQYSTSLSEGLPAVYSHPVASDVAEMGQGDWRRVEGRGRESTIDYLYQLGKIMSSELAYTAFPSYADINRDIDPIRVGEGWRVENGRHRALTLRVLGSQYVRNKGMDRWVTVKRESPSSSRRV